MAFLVLEVLSGLEVDGVSQIFTLFKNVADGGRTPVFKLPLPDFKNDIFCFLTFIFFSSLNVMSIFSFLYYN